MAAGGITYLSKPLDEERNIEYLQAAVQGVCWLTKADNSSRLLELCPRRSWDRKCRNCTSKILVFYPIAFS
jgi:hypothetical protein